MHTTFNSPCFFKYFTVPATFDHADVAKQVYERFNACLDSILVYGLSQANLTPAQLSELPLFLRWP